MLLIDRKPSRLSLWELRELIAHLELEPRPVEGQPDMLVEETPYQMIAGEDAEVPCGLHALLRGLGQP